MQHIVVQTAKPWNLNSSDWVTNGIGRNGNCFQTENELKNSLLKI